MNALNAKKILLGVTGSIAAYKACLLVRLLVKAGAEVQVLLTDAAQDFITPLTLSTLSGKPVLSGFTNGPQEVWNNHVALGLWADAFVVAPATAHTLAKCAHGICDDLMTAVYLSARAPVFFAPAMDLDMYHHGTTRANIERLRSYGNTVLEAGYGDLASGLVGEGRMPEPEVILHSLQKHFSRRPEATGKKVLITAGPTREAIDPVRYISNHSSGKMGYAIANAFSDAGAEVVLVSGPVDPSPLAPSISRVEVQSADEMFAVAHEHFPACDVAICAAAVADYKPVYRAEQKIKKKASAYALELTKTKDIAASFGLLKKSHQLLMGFALETENELDNAISKLHKKAMDFIVLNSLQDKGAGFAHDTNKITVIDKAEIIRKFELKPKTALAQDLVDIILEQWRTP